MNDTIMIFKSEWFSILHKLSLNRVLYFPFIIVETEVTRLFLKNDHILVSRIRFIGCNILICGVYLWQSMEEGQYKVM